MEFVNKIVIVAEISIALPIFKCILSILIFGTFINKGFLLNNL